MKSCKFGDLCVYKHELSSEKKAVNDLTNQVKTLVDIVNSMSNNIARLEAEIKEIKSSDITQMSDFSCEKCNYKASSNTVLKRHTTTKHKHISLIQEKVRSSNTDVSSKLIIPSENRSEPDADNMLTVTQNEPTENIYPPELPQSPITCADLRYGTICHIQGTECIQILHSFCHASLPLIQGRTNPLQQHLHLHFLSRIHIKEPDEQQIVGGKRTELALYIYMLYFVLQMAS